MLSIRKRVCGTSQGVPGSLLSGTPSTKKGVRICRNLKNGNAPSVVTNAKARPLRSSVPPVAPTHPGLYHSNSHVRQLVTLHKAQQKTVNSSNKQLSRKKPASCSRIPVFFFRHGKDQSGTRSNSASHAAASPSLGARQSPRGDRDPPEPTFGELGTQVRLNWLVLKKRHRKTLSQRLIS